MKYRVESDSMGDKNVPEDCYWGAQTQRSLENFAEMGFNLMPIELIRSFAKQKAAAAAANASIGLLDQHKSSAIIKAAMEIAEGRLDNHFPLYVWQTGSGTQTNMNLNEVIANRAIEIIGGKKGSKDIIHPNDHVNKCQSSNDSFPTAMHICAAELIFSVFLPELHTFADELATKVSEFIDMPKIGRTHLQDATPMFLGQEFSGYETQIRKSIKRVEKTLDSVLELAQGGTAVGTGLNAHPKFANSFIKEIKNITGLPFSSAKNKFEAMASNDTMIEVSGSLNCVAISLMKIVNDIRLLSSGPRCGIGEIELPTNEPGSSIMPGKVNPTQCEAVSMICAHVMGLCSAISIGGSHGHLELNVFKPMIIFNIVSSIKLLSGGMCGFRKHCLVGIKANQERMLKLAENSLMLATALNPIIGYDKAAEVAKKAYSENSSLKQAALSLKIGSEEEISEWLNPRNLIPPTIDS